MRLSTVDDVSLQAAFFLPIPPGRHSQWHLESTGQHIISPGHLGEAARQGYIRAKSSPIAAFVFISLSSNIVLGHKAVKFQFTGWILKGGDFWKETRLGGG